MLPDSKARRMLWNMLDAIYIKGFKTFARPVRMPLEDGITAIVGPNGSGKSNITDAVLFALGEQSPSVLRAGAMSDVVFSGSESLPAAGLAEVTLVLDNSGGRISLPYQEVSISRRITRSGETEYKINGSPARLADVRAVAGEAGIGRHSVLRQGAVGAIVAGGPSACRMALEEAAGLGVYRRRRLAASRRLERADAQLEKSRQLESEISTRLRQIEREAAAAREYRNLESRYRRLSLAHLYRVASQGLEGRRRKLEDLESQVRELENQEKTLGQEQDQTGLKLRKIEGELQACEQILEAMEDGAERLRTETLRADRMLLQLGGGRDRKKERAREISRLENELQKIVGTLEAMEQEVRRLEEERSAGRENLTRCEQAAREAREEETDLKRRKARLLVELERLRASLDQDGSWEDEARALSDEDLEQLAAVAAGKTGAVSSGLREVSDALCERLKRHRRVVERSSTEVNRRRGALAALRGDVESRIRFLQDNERDDGPGVRLREVIQAQPGYEAAVDAALKELGDGVLAEDLGEGVRLVSGTQRVAVRLDAQRMEESRTPPGKPLADCVKVTDERYADAVERILCGTYVIEDPARISLDNGYIAVTRRGLRLTRASVSREDGAGDFVRKARLSAEKRRIEDLERGPGIILDELETTISKISERVGGLSTGAEDIRSCVERLHRAYRLLAVQARSRQSRAKNARESLLRNRERSERLKQMISTSEKKLREIESSEKRAEEKVSETSVALESAREKLQRMDQRLSRLREDVARGRDRRDRISMALERGKKLSSAANEREEQLVGRAERVCERLSAALGVRRDDLRRSRGSLNEARLKLSRKQNAQATQAAELAGELARARAECKNLQERLERAEQAAVGAGREIEDEWGATIEEAKKVAEDLAGADVEAERQQLARQLKRFGDVNLLAISQEDELRQRHDFISSQRADAEEASTELNRIIQEIDREIESRFAQTFEQVRRSFGEMVPRMMEGARGELELSEEGVEIGIRLGRRGSRPLRVLSGGERALLALSFLFSIFLGRLERGAGWFCMLDEAEAALDDLNLARFLSVVDSYRAEGQFLLVTHQKRTMASADVLYGVTVDASGATTVVSKRLQGE